MTRVEVIVVHSRALRTIHEEAEHSCADGLESGGILLGRRTEGGIVRVDYAGTPGPAAIRRPDFFLRDLHHTQAFANQHFFDDGAVWVGEWHTHPRSLPVPSHQDLTTYTTLLADSELEFGPEFVSLILGPATLSRQWSIAGWACSEMHGRQVAVQYTNQD